MAMAPASSRPRLGSHGSGIPDDAVYEILLRMPAKDLCRLRAVCQSWNRLISDQYFVAGHAARHPDPLIVAGHDTCLHPDDTICAVIDLSGGVLKRVATARDDAAGEPERVTCAELGVICTTRRGTVTTLHVLATGAVSTLPQELAEEHRARQGSIRNRSDLAVFGQIAATGEYKVLRMIEYFTNHHHHHYHINRMYEVLTLDDRLESTQARWRGKKAPPEAVSLGAWKIAVLNGIVYLLSDEFVPSRGDAARDRVMPFDLETEDWGATLLGPLSSSSHAQVPGTPSPEDCVVEVSICAVNGVLAMAYRKYTPYLDLWFLMDAENGAWVKHHSIQLLPFSIRNDEYTIRPLWVLNDGRIVLAYVGRSGGTLRIYNPRSSTSVDVAQIGPCSALGVFTGSLLSIASSSIS